MARSGFVGILVVGLVAIVAGLIGYQAGLTSNAVASGATVVVTGGFPGFGSLFFLFVLAFVAFSIAGRRRGAWIGHHGHRPWTPGPSAGGPGPGPEAPDPRRQWLADLHRSLHAEEAARSQGKGQSQDSTPA